MVMSWIIYTSNPAEQVSSYFYIDSEFTFSQGDQNWQGETSFGYQNWSGGTSFGGKPIFCYSAPVPITFVLKTALQLVARSKVYQIYIFMSLQTYN